MKGKEVMVTFANYPESKESDPIGPFEYVQLTYDLLRISPEGDSLAWFDGDYWNYDGMEWTDIIISTT